jgi:hypothetical protein
VTEPLDSTAASGRVLALGIYLTDRENRVHHVSQELGRSRRWSVEQRWIALGRCEPPPDLGSVTSVVVRDLRPKFELLNGLLGSGRLDPYDYALVCDDDVHLPEGFVDAYLDLVQRHDLALAQPARAHGSFIDHAIVEQMDGLDARLTRFVEIGPVFSMRRDAVRLLVPFDEASPMGWGYDYVWPVVIEEAGLRMGIVDATPVAHDLRRPAAHYDVMAEQRVMKAFLDARPHVSRAEAFTVLEAYA